MNTICHLYTGVGPVTFPPGCGPVLSAPPNCPTVQQCHPTGGAQAQASIFGVCVTQNCTGVPVVCGSAQAQTFTVPPFCGPPPPITSPADCGLQGGAHAQASIFGVCVTQNCTGVPVVCGSAQAQTATVPPFCGPTPPITSPADCGLQGGAHAQASVFTICPTAHCTGVPVVCSGAQAQAQTRINSVYTVCPTTAPNPGGGAHAQASVFTICPTAHCTGVPVVCSGAQAQTLLSAPPNCPTVQQCHPPVSAATICPTVQQCGGGAQAQASVFGVCVTQNCTGVPVVCGSAQAQTLLSAPPNCPTVQMCPPPLSAPPNCPTVQQCGGGAHAQASVFTICPTAHCTGVPVVCS